MIQNCPTWQRHQGVGALRCKTRKARGPTATISRGGIAAPLPPTSPRARRAPARTLQWTLRRRYETDVERAKGRYTATEAGEGQEEFGSGVVRGPRGKGSGGGEEKKRKKTEEPYEAPVR